MELRSVDVSDNRSLCAEASILRFGKPFEHQMVV